MTPQRGPRTVVLIPGLYDSGPEHWQSVWEQGSPDFRRVRQRNWDTPARSDWVATLDAMILETGPGSVLVAHSTACALVAFWAQQNRRPVRGALLVAPSDTEAPSSPKGPTGWKPMPLAPLPFIALAFFSDCHRWPPSADEDIAFQGLQRIVCLQH